MIFTSANVMSARILFLKMTFQSNIAFLKIDFPKVKSPLRQIRSGMKLGRFLKVQKLNKW